LCRTLVRLKVERVAIERPDGVLIERLLDARLRVIAMHPNPTAWARVCSHRLPIASRCAAHAAAGRCVRPDCPRDRGRRGDVAIIATGRSDYPNQINNVLCFPGIFRGALDVRATAITEEMKTAAARAIADIVSVDELREDYIIPSVFNREVVAAVATAVAEEARESGTAEAAGAEVGFAQTEEFRILPGR
jgi:hypothetical protein